MFAIEVDPHSPGSIEVRLDDPDGRALATVTIGANAVGRGWARFRASVPSPTGAHALYPTVRPDGAEL